MGFDDFLEVGGRRRENKRAGGVVILATLLGALATSPAWAQEASSDSPLRSLMKSAGIVTDVAPPPDFVVQSRPAQPPASIPPFTKPVEPSGKVKSAHELEVEDSDLEALVKRDDALRAAFPPSAKAVAEAAAAKKAKAKAKRPSGGLLPTF